MRKYDGRSTVAPVCTLFFDEFCVEFCVQVHEHFPCGRIPVVGFLPLPPTGTVQSTVHYTLYGRVPDANTMYPVGMCSSGTRDTVQFKHR